MNRRAFLKTAGAGSAVLAAPNVVIAQPKLEWRLASSYPESLETIYGGATALARYVEAATDGAFRITVFPSGELVPGLQVADAVANGAVETGHTASYYFWGKDPAFAFGTAIPFGLNSRQQNAWLYHGGGEELLNDFYAGYNLYGLACGNTGAQMGGWFSKEVKTPEDLQGLKMRIGGIGGMVLARLGVEALQMDGAVIQKALSDGEIDAAEWAGPHDDEQLGLYRAARYYYYPGFWEGGGVIHLFINKEQWEALPKPYQAILTAAAKAVNMNMLAEYDYKNPAALRRLIAEGVQLRAFPQDILEAAFEAAQKTYAELNAAHATFKKMFDHMAAFRKDAYLWTQIAELSFNNFMMEKQRAGQL